MKARSLQLLPNSANPGQSPVTLDCEGGIFWCSLGEDSKGVWLSDRDFNDSNLETTLITFGKAGVQKAVGNPELISRLMQYLKARGLQLENAVGRDGTFSIQFLAAEKRLRLSNDSRIKVLIVDDSSTIRVLLKRVFAEDPGIVVVGEADRPSAARDLIRTLKPDVITLDIHMPEMDGVSFLKEYLVKYPVPTVMISSISREEGPAVLEALEAGAVDYVQKPSASEFNEAKLMILEKVKTAALVKISPKSSLKPVRVLSRASGPVDLSSLIVIGASTGGTEALRNVLIQFPAEIPPVLIVQHIPPVFSKAFADRMNQLCACEVKEAVDGDEVRAGLVLIAPGGTQMSIQKKYGGSGLVVKVDPNAAPVNRHKPSVDVLFHSVAKEAKSRLAGIILTGMGADGARGLLALREKGAYTIAQNEETCVVYGMPREAVKLGAAIESLPLMEISEKILRVLEKKAA